MAPVNTFVWRVRLCLAVAAGGLLLVNGGKSNLPRREQMAGTVIAVNCQAPPARGAAPLQGSGSAPQEANESGRHCGPLATPAPIRTATRPNIKPEVPPPKLGAFAAR
jgi:hypothetical protein